MPRGTNIQLDTSVMDRILRRLDGNTADNVRAVAFNIEGKAKVNIQQMHAIDTGAMLNSVYTRTYKGDNQNGRSVSKAQIDAGTHAKRPDAETYDLPQPSGPHEAVVGPSVAYAAAVHYGHRTDSGDVAGRPFLQNAVRDATNELEAAGRRIVTDGR